MEYLIYEMKVLYKICFKYDMFHEMIVISYVYLSILYHIQFID